MKSLFIVMALLLTGTVAQTKRPTVPVGADAIYVDSAHKWQCITNGGTPHECTDAEILHVLPKPEPMDVPAISLHDVFCRQQAEDILNAERYPENDHACLDGGRSWRRIRYICLDKSRILLTDEGGGKHCVKFPKEQP
jgi:hypothetical protein